MVIIILLTFLLMEKKKSIAWENFLRLIFFNTLSLKLPQLWVEKSCFWAYLERQVEQPQGKKNGGSGADRIHKLVSTDLKLKSVF